MELQCVFSFGVNSNWTICLYPCHPVAHCLRWNVLAVLYVYSKSLKVIATNNRLFMFFSFLSLSISLTLFYFFSSLVSVHVFLFLMLEIRNTQWLEKRCYDGRDFYDGFSCDGGDAVYYSLNIFVASVSTIIPVKCFSFRLHIICLKSNELWNIEREKNIEHNRRAHRFINVELYTKQNYDTTSKTCVIFVRLVEKFPTNLIEKEKKTKTKKKTRIVMLIHRI